MQASFSSAPGLRSSSIGRGLSPRHAHARFVSFSSRSLRFLAATPFFNHFFSRQLPASASCRPDDLHSKKQSRLPLRCCCPRLDSGHRAAATSGRMLAAAPLLLVGFRLPLLRSPECLGARLLFVRVFVSLWFRPATLFLPFLCSIKLFFISL